MRRRPAISSDVRSATRWPTTFAKCSGVRTGGSLPGDDTSTLYSLRYGRSTSVTRSAERVVDAGRVVDVHPEGLRAGELEGEHLHAGDVALYLRRDLGEQCPFLRVRGCHSILSKKNGRSAPISQLTGEMWWRRL